MASLKQIAEATGLSIRTVSRALRGVGSVKPGTKERITEAARQLNYRPNLAARSLRTGRSHNLTVLIQSTDELAMDKVAAFEETARQHGYTVDVSFFRAGESSDPETVARLSEQVLAKRPAGILQILAPDMACTALVGELSKAGIPLVTVDVPFEKHPCIHIDRQQGVYEAVHYLHQSGRRRIAFLGPIGIKHARTRLDGYERALAELGQKPIILSTGTDDQFEAGRAAVAAFLALRERPDAIQAHTDTLALGFLAGLYPHGVRVPDDVALVGFDNRAASALSAPPLTTVAQPSRDVGARAAEFLIRRIEGGRAPAGGWSPKLPTRLVKRESA